MRIGLRGVRTRWVTTVAAVAATLVGVTATPAHASGWQLIDGFESGTAALWSFSGNPGCGFCGYISDDPWQVHGGAQAASIEAMSADSWFSAARTVHLGPAAQHRTTCSARIFVKMPAGQLNFEIIDPATWTYVALTHVGTSNVNYRAVTVGSWLGGPVDVVVRVSVLRVGAPPTTAFAMIDDLTVSCTY